MHAGWRCLQRLLRHRQAKQSPYGCAVLREAYQAFARSATGEEQAVMRDYSGINLSKVVVVSISVSCHLVHMLFSRVTVLPHRPVLMYPDLGNVADDNATPHLIPGP